MENFLLEFDYSKLMDLKIINMFITLVLLLLGIGFINKFIDNCAARLKKYVELKEYDLICINFLPLGIKLAKIFVFCFVILVVGNLHGINFSSILAGIGIGGIAIGFAAKETIADVFGTICLVADKNFKLGDMIQIDKTISGRDLEGVVEDINFRSSRLRSLDGALNIVPNHILASSIIRNYTQSNKKCIWEYIDITYNTPVDKVKEAIEICRTIFQNNNEIIDNYTVELNSLSSSSLKIMVRAYTNLKTWEALQRVRNDILMAIFEKFNHAKIEFAFNTQTLYIKQD